MAAWTTVSTTNLEPGDPWTAALAQAAFENPEAIAEGAANAPRVAWRALERLYLGTIAYGFAAGVNNLEQAENITLLGGMFISGGSSSPQARYSNDNGSSYGSWQDLFVTAGPGGPSDTVLMIQLNLRTGAWALITSGDSENWTGTHTVPSDANAFQVQDAGSGLGRLLVFVTGGVHP